MFVATYFNTCDYDTKVIGVYSTYTLACKTIIKNKIMILNDISVRDNKDVRSFRASVMYYMDKVDITPMEFEKLLKDFFKLDEYKGHRLYNEESYRIEEFELDKI